MFITGDDLLNSTGASLSAFKVISFGLFCLFVFVVVVLEIWDSKNG